MNKKKIAATIIKIYEQKKKIQQHLKKAHTT